MNWPWVSRRTSEAVLQQACDAARRGSEYMGARIESLEREIEFWREKFEKEQARADRAVDSLIAQNGQPPISQESRDDRVKVSDAMIDMQTQVAEIFGDVEGSLVGDPTDPSTQVEAVVPVAEDHAKVRESRLAAIKATIAERKAANEPPASESASVGA